MISTLRKSWPTADWCDVTVAVAVSGGADSVALLLGLWEARLECKSKPTGKLVVAHFNHRLRSTADHDERFVRELAARLGLTCEVGHAEPRRGETATSSPDGIEAAARQARYAFLLQAAERAGARYLATAHTVDDQAETVLHHILRGTGLAGLAGIPRARPLSPAVTLIRPLLDASRTEVVQFLADRHQTYCLDESNEDPSFTRNRIRHALLPQLAAQYNPNVREALVRLGKLASEGQQIIEQRARELLERALREEPSGEVVMNCEALASQPLHLIREVLILVWKLRDWPLQKMGFEAWDELARLVARGSAVERTAQHWPGGVKTELQPGQLRLRGPNSPSST